MGEQQTVDIALANNDRVTLRVGDTFLKIDADHERSAKEAEAIALAPVATPEVRWHRSPVLALAALPGRPLDRLGKPSVASPAAWAAVGAEVRRLHDAPLPPWPDESAGEREAKLERECAWLAEQGVLDGEALQRNRERADLVLEPVSPSFIHGDLHLEHVFVDGDEVTGFIDWSEARRGDPAYDLASLTVGHPERLDDLLSGYGDDVDRDRIRGWWSFRCLGAVRWLTENGYGEPDDLPEVGVLRSVR